MAATEVVILAGITVITLAKAPLLLKASGTSVNSEIEEAMLARRSMTARNTVMNASTTGTDRRKELRCPRISHTGATTPKNKDRVKN